ncbi:cytochrome P450 [Dictyobacter alpinus]|uniref:Cytochrome P450 n=1 Tax=Dictyobacter alpinus TaxID=2014873 RepID=A0A402BK05_9CHLR|nr:cytochrome P450 [Dictyobacter alpinus]GCE31679.1 cytochrome P450 [Dictyobacter alpinus]
MVTSNTSPITKAVPFTHEHFLLGSYKEFLQDRMDFLPRLAQQGDVMGFHIGPVPMLLFNKAEYAHYVLVEHADDFSKGRLMRKAVGNNGLFVSEGAFHRRQHKLIAPVFQPRHIVSYADTIVSYAGRVMQEWENGAIIDINKYMIRFTMSIIGKVLFDTDFLSETDDLGSAINIGLAHAVRTLTTPFTLPLNIPTPHNRHVRQATQLVEARLRQMIEERRQNPGERNDLLSLLLQARDEDGQPMSERQLIDECMTVFTAGHETTAAALAWTWYLLCTHPECYQKLQQEVDQELQGRLPTYTNLPRLSYCLQVFKETMRIYPPAPGILREALHDLVIDGYKVPKGATLMISPYTLHRRSDAFPDPEQFQPERFTPQQEKLLPRSAYIPFSDGPRICIGNHFALMEGQLLIAAIVQRYSFRLVPGQHIVPDIAHNLALRPGGKVEVVVSTRT